MKTRDKIQKYMNLEKLTRYRLAKKLNVQPTTVTNWLDGRNIDVKNISAIADFFGVTQENLLNDEESVQPAAKRLYTIAGKRNLALDRLLQRHGYTLVQIHKYKLAANDEGASAFYGQEPALFRLARETEVTFDLQADASEFYEKVSRALISANENTTSEPSLDTETVDIAQEIQENPDLRALVSAGQKASPEALKLIVAHAEGVVELEAARPMTYREEEFTE